jgi:hypothetical protein
MIKEKEKEKKETIEDKADLTGRKGITVMFDEPRFLRLDLLGVAWIEDNVLPGRALPIDVIMSNLGRIGFLKVILQAALGLVHNEPKVKADKIPEIFEAYIENTGDLEDLKKVLQEVYSLFAKNPTKMAEERRLAEQMKKAEASGEK